MDVLDSALQTILAAAPVIKIRGAIYALVKIHMQGIDKSAGRMKRRKYTSYCGIWSLA